MDDFLTQLGVQAVNYAMRCGIALTSTFALQQCSRLLKTVDDQTQYAELEALQATLDSKMKIVSPALDLIAFKSGRGNVFLGHAATLATALHRDIVALGRRVERVAAAEEAERMRQKSSCSSGHAARVVAVAWALNSSGERWREQRLVEVVDIIAALRRLLARIDGDVPLLQLAITASGESLATALPASVSPSRLLQASMLLTMGDAQFCSRPRRVTQIGPSFALSLYMLFVGHAATVGEGDRSEANTQPYGTGADDRKPIWQEVIHKARVRVCRTPLGCPYSLASGAAAASGHDGDYAYCLEIVEDLEDGRVHGNNDDSDDGNGMAYDGIRHAGIREAIPMHQIAKLFYTDAGHILNIGSASDGANNSVLLLKREVAAAAPTRTMAHMMLLPDGDKDEDDEPQPEEQAQMARQQQDEHGHACCPSADGVACSALCYEEACRLRLPPHLDPEWLALEVLVEGEDDGDENDEDDEDAEDDEDDEDVDEDGSDGNSGEVTDKSNVTATKRQPSSDTCLLAEQLRNMAITNTDALPDNVVHGGSDDVSDDVPRDEPHDVPRSPVLPFGPVVSSLSLLEMLVRLTSLQTFQQASHLSIPDHILSFFLEETSTTGLHGAAQRQARQSAEQRMGFDPFTDAAR